uniref:Bifunctional apoptosis regulator-like n=1 Tax=Saccoglossus kowalevskii TaxID=10224 RepID=A0ABM0MF00_SACKO|nr:PREDICTED: bifunctional apoptosis regulator-like [Saccoglossus kowalevskii]
MESRSVRFGQDSVSGDEDEQTFLEQNGVDDDPLQYDTVTTTNNRESTLRRTMSETIFNCGCCYELMVQPTTLNCGHSFCRLCLARWWKISNNTTCPGCRQQWNGFPHINIILRTTLEKMFPQNITSRREQLNNADNKSLLDEFEKFGKDVTKKQKKQSNSGFCSGVFFSLAIVLLLCLVWGFRDDDNLLVKKPVIKWTSSEVAEWVAEFGAWAIDNHYPEKFLTNNVDGRLLLGITEDDLKVPPFNINIQLYRRAIMSELRFSYDPTVEQWIDFIPKYIFFPYYLIARFTSNWIDVHDYTCWFIFVNCVLLTFIEATVFRWLWRQGLRSIPSAMRRHLLAMIGTTILVLMWPVIPFFICDSLFYWALYFTPVLNIEKILKILKG